MYKIILTLITCVLIAVYFIFFHYFYESHTPSMKWWSDYKNYLEKPIYEHAFELVEMEEGGVITGKILTNCRLEVYKLKDDRGFYNSEQVMEKLPVSYYGEPIDRNTKAYFGDSKPEQLFYTNWLPISELNMQLFNPYGFKLDKVYPKVAYDQPINNTSKSLVVYERLMSCYNALNTDDFIAEPIIERFQPIQQYPAIKEDFLGFEGNKNELIKLRKNLAKIMLRKDTIFKMHTSCHNYTEIEFLNAKEGIIFFWVLYAGMPSPHCGDIPYRISNGWLKEDDIYLDNAKQISDKIKRF